MAFCSYCGGELPTDAATCPACGHPVSGVPASGVLASGVPASGVPAGALLPAAGPDQNEGFAIASLACAIGGLTVIPLIGSILGVVFGRIAQTRIAQNPSLQGESMARAGVIIGWVGIGLAIAAFLVVLLLTILVTSLTF